MNWLKLYNEQITNYQKEIYNLNLKLYFSSSSQQQSQSAPLPPKSQVSITTTISTAVTNLQKLGRLFQ